MNRQRYQLEWSGLEGTLRAYEPTGAQVAEAAAALAESYNDPVHGPLMGHDEAFSEEDVREHVAWIIEDGGRAFLLEWNGLPAGDADLRGLTERHAELAILVGVRAPQGRGLGTRFAVMVTAFAFRVLGLERVYVSILPDNAASLRLFEKVGYRPDDSAAARACAESDDEVTLSIGALDLGRAHPWCSEIRFARLPDG